MNSLMNREDQRKKKKNMKQVAGSPIYFEFIFP